MRTRSFVFVCRVLIGAWAVLVCCLSDQSPFGMLAQRTRFFTSWTSGHGFPRVYIIKLACWLPRPVPGQGCRWSYAETVLDLWLDIHIAADAHLRICRCLEIQRLHPIVPDTSSHHLEREPWY